MEDKRQRISIVIPAYNEERYIGACLDTIAGQTVAPYEVIVADNNSTDATVAIAQQYPFVRVVHVPQQGVVFARDAGFDAARGEIIGRIDADTRLPSNWVAAVSAFYADERHSRQAWTGGAVPYNVRLPRFNAWLQQLVAFQFNRRLLGHNILYGTNMALPTALWSAVRGNVCRRTDIHEDLDLSIHLHRNGYVISYQKNTLVGAKLRRVRSDRGALWQNLMWWPQTLRVHGMPGWIGGFIGAVLLYLASPAYTIGELIARLLGKPPLAE